VRQQVVENIKKSPSKGDEKCPYTHLKNMCGGIRHIASCIKKKFPCTNREVLYIRTSMELVKHSLK
jgi:hypothetical protein